MRKVIALLLLVVAMSAACSANVEELFLCREMWIVFALPFGSQAEYFPNPETARPMVSVTGMDGEEIAGIVWFKDLTFRRDPLTFVQEWVLKGNTIDVLLQPEPSFLDTLDIQKKVELWESGDEGLRKTNEFWYLTTGVGPAVLVVTTTPVEGGTTILYSAYTKRRGHIFWIYSTDKDVFQKIMSTIQGVML